MTFVPGYYRDLQYRKARLDKTEELLPYKLREVLAAELADILPKWAEQDRLEQFEEDMQTRVRETF